jgi:hypothetical protein
MLPFVEFMKAVGEEMTIGSTYVAFYAGFTCGRVIEREFA